MYGRLIVRQLPLPLDSGPVSGHRATVMKEKPTCQEHQASARAALRALTTRAQRNSAEQAELDAKAADTARQLDQERHLSEEKLRRRVTL